MKKIILFLIIILSVTVCINYPHAETTDITPPEIKSITIDKTNYNAGENISFTVDASDDISGIRDVIVTYIKKGETTFEINTHAIPLA